MSQLSTQIGIALIFLGLLACFFSFEITALIPSFFGLAYVFLGSCAQKAKFRKLGLSGAVLWSIIGVFMAISRLLQETMQQDFAFLTFMSFLGLLLLCGVYLAQSVKNIRQNWA